MWGVVRAANLGADCQKGLHLESLRARNWAEHWARPTRTALYSRQLLAIHIGRRKNAECQWYEPELWMSEETDANVILQEEPQPSIGRDRGDSAKTK